MGTEPRKLLSDLEALARLRPEAAESAAALEATRAALVQRRRTRRPRRWLRVTIPSGIAACLVAAALLAWFVQSSGRADASLQLQAAVQKAQDYRGWVQVVATPRGGGGGGGGAMSGRGMLVSITCRSNAAEGLYGEVRQFQNDTEMTFCSVKQDVYESYTRSAGEIRRRTLAMDDDDDTPRDVLLPATIGEALTRVKSTLGREPASLKHSHEGQEVRIDVTLFRSHEEENEFHRKDHSKAGTPAQFSVWVDPQNQMTRLTCAAPGGTLESTITYGAAPVGSIYDLGVPRDAKVTETRSEERDHH